MSIAIPKRVVIQGLTLPLCRYRIAENGIKRVRVDYMTCCIQSLDICIAQNADAVFQLYDATDVDYSLATEITFDIWESIGGASVLTKTLSGGDITLANDYTFTFAISNAESGAMTTTKKYCEAWVTLAGGEQRCVGAGAFVVKDTRKHD